MEKIKKNLPILLFFAGLAFTRFYNLPQTSRFTRDESSNLVDMHRIYVDKELTMIGPVDVANTIIYPSLTFYMLMPFAIVGGFTTYSPAYGTAFYSIITAVLLYLIAKQVKFGYLFIISALLIFWFPLLESGRWAWNPHLVPFVQALALYYWIKNKKYSVLTGICLGAVFHLHYFTVFSTAAFMLVVFIESLKSKKLKNFWLMLTGFLIMIVPFVIFDLRNPPGLFFGKFLSNNLVSQGSQGEFSNLPISFIENIWNSLIYLTQNAILAGILGWVLSVLLISDITNKERSIIYFVPILFQIIAISFLPVFQGRYFLLGIIFFYLWIIDKRKINMQKIQVLSLSVMIFGGILSFGRVVTKPPIQPGTYIVEKASQIIFDNIKSSNLKNVNIAVLASPDPDPLGVTYRNTILVKGEKILTESEYGITDNLFVITTSDESTVRNDPANLIQGFRGGRLDSTYPIDNTLYKVYLFNR